MSHNRNVELIPDIYRCYIATTLSAADLWYVSIPYKVVIQHILYISCYISHFKKWHPFSVTVIYNQYINIHKILHVGYIIISYITFSLRTMSGLFYSLDLKIHSLNTPTWRTPTPFSIQQFMYMLWANQHLPSTCFEADSQYMAIFSWGLSGVISCESDWPVAPIHVGEAEGEVIHSF